MFLLNNEKELQLSFQLQNFVCLWESCEIEETGVLGNWKHLLVKEMLMRLKLKLPTQSIQLTNSNCNVQDSLGYSNLENHPTEPSEVSNEIQIWTQILNKKSHDRLLKIREEMDNKLEAILKEKEPTNILPSLQIPDQRLMEHKTCSRRDLKLMSLGRSRIKQYQF